MLVGYTVEILPFQIRARGLAVMFFFVNAALFFNNYVNPVALSSIGWKYYIVYDSWLAFELIFVFFFFPETRYTPLEEIAKYFDGEDAVVGGEAATLKSRNYLGSMQAEGKVVDEKEIVKHLENDRRFSHRSANT